MKSIWSVSFQAITLLAAMGAVAALAAQNPDANPERHVTVCMEADVRSDIPIRARWLASKMFAEIGVTLHWRDGLRHCLPQDIAITLDGPTPTNLKLKHLPIRYLTKARAFTFSTTESPIMKRIWSRVFWRMYWYMRLRTFSKASFVTQLLAS